jgi:protein ImuB
VPRASREALATLPVEALRLEPEDILLLKRLGLRRIGQLYDIPRAALARRFRELAGRAGHACGRTDRAVAVLTRLDQARGHVPEPVEPLVAPAVYSVRRAFSDPLISAEGIEAEVAVLVAELCTHLEAADCGARSVRLCFYRADGTCAEARAGTSNPCREPAHMLGLLSEKVAAVDAGFGIDVVTLEAVHVEPLGRSQTALSDLVQRSRADSAALIDRLSNRLGAERVMRLVACESHIPERAQRLVPAMASRARPHRSSPPSPVLRPPLLLPRPEPISVLAEVPEGPPARFTWRHVSHRIVKAEGPERIAPEWWCELGAASPARPRDYYRIEDMHGGRYCVFREGLFGRDTDETPPQWFMHGVFG